MTFIQYSKQIPCVVNKQKPHRFINPGLKVHMWQNCQWGVLLASEEKCIGQKQCKWGRKWFICETRLWSSWGCVINKTKTQNTNCEITRIPMFFWFFNHDNHIRCHIFIRIRCIVRLSNRATAEAVKQSRNHDLFFPGAKGRGVSLTDMWGSRKKRGFSSLHLLYP